MPLNLEARVVRKISWRILPFVMLLYFVSFLDRVNVGFAALSMNKAIGLTPAMFGLGGGIFFIGYFLFEGAFQPHPSTAVSARLLDRARVMVTPGVWYRQPPHLQLARTAITPFAFCSALLEAGFFQASSSTWLFGFPSGTGR